MALYNDRVYAYERMQALDSVIDSATDEQLSAFVDDDDRNHLAFIELKVFEKHGEFLYLHPLLKDQAREHELEILRKTNPAEFTKQMVNAQKSIERYTSRINKQKYKSEQERADWLALIDAYAKKLDIMQLLISK